MGKIKSKCNEIFHFEFSGQLIYEISFAAYFVIAFFQTSTYTIYFPGNVLHRISFIPLAFVLFKIIFYDSDTINKVIINLLSLTLLFITWRTSGDFVLFPLGIFILGVRDVNFRRIVYIYLVLGTILLTFIFFTSLMGLTKALIFHRGSHTIRRAFGIIYPTDFAAHVLYLVLAYCYLNFKKLSWKSYLVFILLAIFLIRFSDARLNAYSLILVIPIMMIGQRAQEKYIVSRNIANFYWSIPILAGYSFTLLCYLYTSSNKIFEKLNSLLSGRLYLSHLGLEKYGISMFGQHIRENGLGAVGGIKNLNVNDSNYFYIDSAFIRLLILYGLLITLLVIFIMTAISWVSIKKRDYALASIMVIVTISALVEPRIIDMGYDPFLIAVLARCYENKKIGDNDENIYIK